MENVQHNTDEKKFYMEIEGKEALLSYDDSEAGVLDFNRTFVPPEGRGKGIARLLTEAGLEYARQNNFKVRPSCSYVEKYFEKHPEVQELKA